LRRRIATAIALLFHVCGIVGILLDIYKDFFIGATAFNLLLMFVLLLWTQRSPGVHFFLFMAIVILAGIGVEIIGVNTGVLFGQYSYGTVLGYKWMGVPLLIGINWFIAIYCCGITIHSFLQRVIRAAAVNSDTPAKTIKALSVVVDGATLAVFFDWVMEPVAVKMGFWQWGGNGSIPSFNYVCWFGISLLLLTCFHFLQFKKSNKFAVHLLLIQVMFFLILRTFL
jgi:bisanhydrobacterioruberin hydratase